MIVAAAPSPDKWPAATAWKWAILAHAPGVAAIVIGFYYGCFALANRYAIFLYFHLGAGPFDPLTVSRYWMTGLVASGMALVAYTTINWMLGRLAGLQFRTYSPPAWWQVWLGAASLVMIGIPLITMTQNTPTLPMELAALCTVATLAGLAVALMPGQLAAQRPAELLWLILYGVGLSPMLLLVRAIELPARGLATTPTAYGVAIAGGVAGVLWLIVLQWWRGRLCKSRFGPVPILLAGVIVSYLLLPLAHFLFLTPPQFHYISAASNFFAFTPEVQALSWAIAVIAASVIGRRQVGHRREGHYEQA